VSAGHFYICYSVQQTLFHIAFSLKYCPGRHFNIVHYYVLQCLTFCPILCSYVLGSVLWSLLRLPHESDVRFVITSLFVGGLMSYLCYHFCLSRIVMSNTHWRVSYKGHELLILREHLSWPQVFCGVSVSHLFICLCCVCGFFSLFVFVVCLVHPMLSVSLIDPYFFLTFFWNIARLSMH